MNIKPLGKRVIVEPEDEHTISEGGLFIASDVRSYRYGIIKAMGPDCQYYAIGDRIMYVREACEEIIVDKDLPSELKFFILYNEDDIYAKIA